MTQDLRTKFIDFDARRDPKTDFFCCACQKDMDRSKACYAVHLVDGGPFALHPDDEVKYIPDGGELGCHPIGNDCAKKLGLEWCHPKAIWPQFPKREAGEAPTYDGLYSGKWQHATVSGHG
jgi:hypothetical protein